ncbi:MAG: GNAT family N-acetyltransferase [Candidatus Diapherotrites archaeon]
MAVFKIVPFESLDFYTRKEAVLIGQKTVKNAKPKFKVKALSRDDLVFVALKDEKPVGIINASVCSWHGKNCLRILGLYTKPSPEFYRQSGKTVGEALVEKTVMAALVKGCNIVVPLMPNKHSKALIKRYIERGIIEPVGSGFFSRPYRIAQTGFLQKGRESAKRRLRA